MNIETVHALLDGKEVNATFHLFDDGVAVWHHIWAHPDLRSGDRYMEFMEALAPGINELLGESYCCVGQQPPTRRDAKELNENRTSLMSALFERPVASGEFGGRAYFYTPPKMLTMDDVEMPEWVPERVQACHG